MFLFEWNFVFTVKVTRWVQILSFNTIWKLLLPWKLIYRQKFKMLWFEWHFVVRVKMTCLVLNLWFQVDSKDTSAMETDFPVKKIEMLSVRWIWFLVGKWYAESKLCSFETVLSHRRGRVLNPFIHNQIKIPLNHFTQSCAMKDCSLI